MADALRAIGRAVPPFRTALRLHLIETSPRLRAAQATVLPEATWHDSVDDLPGGPLLLLGNEFLDALPIRQFVRRGGGWAERHVGPNGWIELPATDAPAGGNAPAEGAVVEICEPAERIATVLGTRFTRERGAALFLDYGPEHSTPGDSLQAITGGKPADPLSVPGTADLTAHVDFATLARLAIGAGTTVHGPVPQGMFLARLGLFQRSHRLARHLPPARAASLTEGARRLAEPNRMGRLFKALALVSPGLPVLPGFEE
jgi:SAM-dependent MidA family methyltransferase